MLDASGSLAATLGLQAFAGAVRLALPLVALLLLGNLLLAIVTRSAPQIGGLAIGPAGLLLLIMLALPLVFEDLVLRAGTILAGTLVR